MHFSNYNYYLCTNIKLILNIKRMNTEKIKNREAFVEYYKSLEDAERITFRKKVIKACKIEHYTFNNWLYAGIFIPVLAQEKITRIIGKNIFKEEE